MPQKQMRLRNDYYTTGRMTTLKAYAIFYMRVGNQATAKPAFGFRRDNEQRFCEAERGARSACLRVENQARTKQSGKEKT